MIRLIIVEDEKAIRNGIEKNMPWKDMGVDEVKTAENAEAAFVICEAYHPDIIISDIRMPGMDGIELCTRFHEILPESQIIFISGFSDKEYLMAAIHLNAVGYVEKPISIEELCGAVKKATEQIYRLEKQNHTMLHTLLRPGELEEDKVFQTLRLYEKGKILEQDTAFSIGLLQSRDEIRRLPDISGKIKEQAAGLIEPRNIHLLVDTVGFNNIVILFSGNIPKSAPELEVTDIMEQIYQLILECREEQEHWFLGIGRKVENIQALSSSYQTAKEAQKAVSYLGWNTFASYDVKMQHLAVGLGQEEQNQFRKMLLDRKTEEVQGYLRGLYEHMVEECYVIDFNLKNQFYILDSIIHEADRQLNRNQEAMTDCNMHFLDETQTMREMYEYISDYADRMLKSSDEDQNNSFVVNKVIAYMEEHLGDKGISIQMMADHVFLTPTYLSSLFKKKTGTTIGKYLTDIRMKKAEELLMNPSLRLYQVAELVGYEDANYFAKSFKKKTGLLPSEYRESRL